MARLFILPFLLLVTVAMAVMPEHRWKDFKEKFGKKYKSSSDEDESKRDFMDNMKKIEEHNARFELKLETFKLGYNEFSDMSFAKFAAKFRGTKPRVASSRHKRRTEKKPPIVLPDEVDYRITGCVAPVKHQGSCGSCWSFVATSALESLRCLMKGELDLVLLSEQNLVDCTADNEGCAGGWVHKGWQYVRDNHGINTQATYPYTGVTSPVCGYMFEDNDFTVSGHTKLQKGEANLQQAVAEIGPMAASGVALSDMMKQYSSGVYNDKQCNQMAVDSHAFLIVGYGTEDGNDYWIARNSWGAGWGEGGYIRMSRNKKNQCNIASYVEYPTVVLK